MPRTLLCAWIADGWIYSREPSQDARYWIDDNWIWGPVGAADAATGYWIQDGWILGPRGAADPFTGFRIEGEWITGPRVLLPFVAPHDPAAG
jgi:hypothetical protein